MAEIESDIQQAAQGEATAGEPAQLTHPSAAEAPEGMALEGKAPEAKAPEEKAPEATALEAKAPEEKAKEAARSLEDILWSAASRWDRGEQAFIDREEFAARIFTAWEGDQPTEEFVERFFGGEAGVARPAEMAEAIVRSKKARMTSYQFDLNALEYVVIEDKESLVVVSQAGEFALPSVGAVRDAIFAAVRPGTSGAVGSGRASVDRSAGGQARAYLVRQSGEIAAVDVGLLAQAIKAGQSLLKNADAPLLDRPGSRLQPFQPRLRTLSESREVEILRRDRRVARFEVPAPVAGAAVASAASTRPPAEAEQSVLLLLPDGTLARPVIGSASRWQEMLSGWAGRAAARSADASDLPLRASGGRTYVAQSGKLVAVFEGGATGGQRSDAVGLPGSMGQSAELRSTALRSVRSMETDVRVLGDDALAEAVARGAKVVGGWSASATDSPAGSAAYWVQPEVFFDPTARESADAALDLSRRRGSGVLGDSATQNLVSKAYVPAPSQPVQLGQLTGDPWADWALATGGELGPVQPFAARADRGSPADGAVPLDGNQPATVRAIRELSLFGRRVAAFRAPDGSLVVQSPRSVRLAEKGRQPVGAAAEPRWSEDLDGGNGQEKQPETAQAPRQQRGAFAERPGIGLAVDEGALQALLDRTAGISTIEVREASAGDEVLTFRSADDQPLGVVVAKAAAEASDRRPAPPSIEQVLGEFSAQGAQVERATPADDRTLALRGINADALREVVQRATAEARTRAGSESRTRAGSESRTRAGSESRTRAGSESPQRASAKPGPAEGRETQAPLDRLTSGESRSGEQDFKSIDRGSAGVGLPTLQPGQERDLAGLLRSQAKGEAEDAPRPVSYGEKVLSFRASDGALVLQPLGDVRLAAWSRRTGSPGSQGEGQPADGSAAQQPLPPKGSQGAQIGFRSGAVPATALGSLALALERTAAAGGFKLPPLRLLSAPDALEVGQDWSRRLEGGSPLRTSVRLAGPPEPGPSGQVSRMLLSMPFPSAGELAVGGDLSDALQMMLSAPAIPARPEGDAARGDGDGNGSLGGAVAGRSARRGLLLRGDGVLVAVPAQGAVSPSGFAGPAPAPPFLGQSASFSSPSNSGAPFQGPPSAPGPGSGALPAMTTRPDSAVLAFDKQGGPGSLAEGAGRTQPPARPGGLVFDLGGLHQQATGDARQAFESLQAPGVAQSLPAQSNLARLPTLLRRALASSGEWVPGPGATLPDAVQSFAMASPFDLPELAAAEAPSAMGDATLLGPASLAYGGRKVHPGEEEIVIPMPLWAQMGRGRLSETQQILASPRMPEGFSAPLGSYRLVAPTPVDLTGGAPVGSADVVTLGGPTRLSVETPVGGGVAAKNDGGQFVLGRVPVALDPGADGPASGRRGRRGRIDAPLSPAAMAALLARRSGPLGAGAGDAGEPFPTSSKPASASNSFARSPSDSAEVVGTRAGPPPSSSSGASTASQQTASRAAGGPERSFASSARSNFPSSTSAPSSASSPGSGFGGGSSGSGLGSGLSGSSAGSPTFPSAGRAPGAGSQTLEGGEQAASGLSSSSGSPAGRPMAGALRSALQMSDDVGGRALPGWTGGPPANGGGLFGGAAGSGDPGATGELAGFGPSGGPQAGMDFASSPGASTFGTRSPSMTLAARAEGAEGSASGAAQGAFPEGPGSTSSAGSAAKQQSSFGSGQPLDRMGAGTRAEQFGAERTGSFEGSGAGRSSAAADAAPDGELAVTRASGSSDRALSTRWDGGEADSSPAGLPRGTWTGDSGSAPGYAPWSYSPRADRSPVVKAGGINLSQGLTSAAPLDSLPTGLRFRYAGAPLWWRSGATGTIVRRSEMGFASSWDGGPDSFISDAESADSPQSRFSGSLRSALRSANSAATLWRSIFVHPANRVQGKAGRGPEGSGSDDTGGMDRGWEQGVSEMSSLGGRLAILAIGVGGGAGAAQQPPPAVGRGAESVYIAMDKAGRGGVANARQAAQASSLSMSIVAAVPPSPPSLEEMASLPGSSAVPGSQQAEVRPRKAGQGGHGAEGKSADAGVSLSKIEGSVDAIAQRIYHRIRRRIESDRERFGG